MSSVSLILRLPLLLFQLARHMLSQALNKRSFFGLLLNFALNFSPVFIWLLMFKNAGIVPNEIRPTIHVKLAMSLDSFVFDVHRLSAWLSFLLILTCSYLLWSYFYQVPRRARFESSQEVHELVIPTKNDEENQFVNNVEMTHLSQTGTVSVGSSGSSGSSASSTDLPLASSAQPTYLPVSCIYSAPVLFLALCWPILNIDHALIYPQTTARDLLAWFSYVLLHFFAPLFTAIYLYVFQAPGAIKWFSFALGTQNIAGVITHMLFPNAPPWFIFLYGEDAAANYDMPGYAAGLTRVDVALGTHLNSDGFHKSPIVFGAIPSLHSAMAVQCTLFVAFYTRWWFPKAGMFAFVILQWWATMYLDHHWRLDLIIGLAYAIISFTIYKRRLEIVEHNFVKARLRGDFEGGSSYGMRVFRNHWLKRLFDPYF
ncbi:hypothetical protein KL928_002956 [Ogataea angusta]|uniref:Phosphatidic acid phosphatase type 2/haloperoxidase domain-containing protein n=1 Tax=Pichia angusta TaxID=870730 RepID=A0AAN6I5W2_PICAN|nr:uncharacterized protein KL928_002956 [Ogataea angusta]KAG7819088.1 hypothetical protein KL928_002956 [Ogataea angusta]